MILAFDVCFMKQLVSLILWEILLYLNAIMSTRKMSCMQLWKIICFEHMNAMGHGNNLIIACQKVAFSFYFQLCFLYQQKLLNSVWYQFPTHWDLTICVGANAFFAVMHVEKRRRKNMRYETVSQGKNQSRGSNSVLNARDK